jgi:hypothetical protein
MQVSGGHLPNSGWTEFVPYDLPPADRHRVPGEPYALAYSSFQQGFPLYFGAVICYNDKNKKGRWPYDSCIGLK